MTKHRVRVREWLNPDGEGKAFIIARVDDRRGEPMKSCLDNSVEASFSIGDCSRSIDLEFGVYWGYEAEGIIHKLAKARLLRDTVNQFVDAYEAEVALYLERQPEAKRLAEAAKKKQK